MPSPPPKLLTTHDLATLIQIDPSTLSKWIDKGILVAYRTPGGHRRIRLHDAVAFLHHHKMPVPPELLGEAAPPQLVDRRGAGRPRLLVLDDPYWVDRTRDALEEAFQLSVTTNPLEAMLLLAEQRPGFVLVELNLKGLSGLDVIRTLREHDSLKAVRVAAMTPLPSKIAERKAKEAGAEALLAKPTKVEAVHAVLLRGS